MILGPGSLGNDGLFQFNLFNVEGQRSPELCPDSFEYCIWHVEPTKHIMGSNAILQTD